MGVAVVGVPTSAELAGDVETPVAGGGIGLDPVFQVWSNLWNSALTGEQDQYYNLTKVNVVYPLWSTCSIEAAVHSCF